MTPLNIKKLFLGIIGAGNMGAAIIKGLINSKTLSSRQIMIYDKDKKKSESIIKEIPVNQMPDSKIIAAKSDIVILAVKPNMISSVCNEIKKTLKTDSIVISIAAGIQIKDIEENLGIDKKIIRLMPNTPALIQEAAIALSINKNISKSDLAIVIKLLSSLGLILPVEEKSLDAVTGLSGSGPAFVYVFIEALADGGVRAGLSRDIALQLAVQTVIGSAKLMKSLKLHPGELKDMVCSAGGTTIAGIHNLENGNFRGSVIDAVYAAYKRSIELSNN